MFLRLSGNAIEFSHLEQQVIGNSMLSVNLSLHYRVTGRFMIWFPLTSALRLPTKLSCGAMTMDESWNYSALMPKTNGDENAVDMVDTDV